MMDKVVSRIKSFGTVLMGTPAQIWEVFWRMLDFVAALISALAARHSHQAHSFNSQESKGIFNSDLKLTNRHLFRLPKRKIMMVKRSHLNPKIIKHFHNSTKASERASSMKLGRPRNCKLRR